MRHRNSVFHDILKLVPWTAFDRVVDQFGADEGTRSFTARQHLSALLFAQLSGSASLREIEATMASHQGRLYHAGAVAPKRSTFADANRARDFRVSPACSNPCWLRLGGGSATEWPTRCG